MQQIQLPSLAEGEVYLGGFVDANGDVAFTILLPGETKTTWKEALEWAKNLGGDLMTRAEQAVAYATLRDQFEQAAYWSNEEDTDDPGWAWFQHFSRGSQGSCLQYYELRARAVRRVIV